MAINFKGKWSSIRPSSEVAPTDMRRNGAFKIDKYDTGTGEVSGKYYDLEGFFEADLTGTITPAGGSYKFSLEHADKITGATIKYEGNFIAEKHDIHIVSGIWYTVWSAKLKRTERDPEGLRQDDGVWVATKP